MQANMNHSNSDLPNGEWKGFFLEKHQPKRGWMHLYLSFEDEQMKGEGTDYVGPWHIVGSFDDQKNIAWTKQYVSKHQVHYSGVYSEQGIRGEWNIGGFPAGFFHIWPKGTREIDKFYLENEIDIDGSEFLPAIPSLRTNQL